MSASIPSLATEPTDVVHLPTWSVKAWWSLMRHQWLIQIEHEIPARGGWIRAWLATPDATLACFDSLAAAHAAGDAFLRQPTWNQCLELTAV